MTSHAPADPAPRPLPKVGSPACKPADMAADPSPTQ